MNSKIIKLTAENVKRLRAVEIRPDGNLVVIGGKNGAGKTSVLDSIMYALAGGKTLPQVPVRKGEETAAIELDLGDLLVKRTFTSEGSTTLTVTSKEGLRHSSPQSVLDKLVGKLSFDPLEFSRQSPADQAETLRKLVGLDFTTEAKERQIAYDSRTVSFRELSSLEARLQAMPLPVAGLPPKETSTADILAAQSKAQQTNSENNRLRQQSKLTEEHVEQLRHEVDRLDGELKLAVEKLSRAREIMTERQVAVASLRDIDLSDFPKQVEKIEATNRAIRAATQRAELAKQVKAKKTERDAFTAKIEAIDQSKREKVSAAKFPVELIGLDDTGRVTFNGLPFEQASSADQLRVSLAIGLAMNPALRVLLIRDGSLLDPDSLKLVADMAAKADAQVWLERVGSDGQVSVIIEDGMVLSKEAQ